MPSSSVISAPDMCLLLRADAEQRWLHREVIPVLRELEAPDALTEEQLEAALAYLETMWGEATLRARATDTAHRELPRATGRDTLSETAARYHAAVRVLRELVATRVNPFVSVPREEQGAYSQPLLADAAAGGGCAPRAA